jgi:hypothetical protein
MLQEGLDKLKNLFTSLGLKPETFQLVIQCLNHYATAFPNNNSPLTVSKLEKIKQRVPSVSTTLRQILKRATYNCNNNEKQKNNILNHHQLFGTERKKLYSKPLSSPHYVSVCVYVCVNGLPILFHPSP